MNNGTNNNAFVYDGTLSYDAVRTLITNYFAEVYNLPVGTVSINYFINQLMTGYNYDQCFFINDKVFGDSKFNVLRADVINMTRRSLAKQGFDLIGGLNCDVTGVHFKYNQNVLAKNTYDLPENQFTPDITFTGTLSYQKIRDMVIEHYKRVNNVDLETVSIDYLANQLRSGTPGIQKFFVSKGAFGVSRFNLPNEEIEKIVKEELDLKGYEVLDFSYHSWITVHYRLKSITKGKQNIVQSALSKMEEIEEPVNKDAPDLGTIDTSKQDATAEEEMGTPEKPYEITDVKKLDRSKIFNSEQLAVISAMIGEAIAYYMAHPQEYQKNNKPN